MSIERAARRIQNCARWSEGITEVDGLAGYSSDYRKGQAAAYAHALDIVKHELENGL